MIWDAVTERLVLELFGCEYIIMRQAEDLLKRMGVLTFVVVWLSGNLEQVSVRVFFTLRRPLTTWAHYRMKSVFRPALSGRE